MASTPLGFGIVGTGMISHYHAQAINALTGAKLIGVASRDAAKATAFAARHHAPFATTDLAALLARTDVHVVCITTPSGAHLAPALAAIRAGKHVVIEKPVEITTARVDEILAAAEKARVTVAPIFQARFGAGARQVKAAAAAGRLGRLVIANAAVKWHRAPAYYTGWKGTLDLDGGGAVINQAIHGLDLLQWFVGLPTEVFAWKTNRVHTGIAAEDTACAALKFPDGALGTFEATTATWPGWARRLELCGERGSVALEDDRIVRWDFADAQPGDDAIRTAKPDAAMGSGSSAPNAISFAGHQAQLQDLVDALATGRAPALTGAEGRHAVALVNALYASAQSGQPARVG